MSEQVTKRPRAPYVSENAESDWSRFKDSVRKIVQAPKKEAGKPAQATGMNSKQS